MGQPEVHVGIGRNGTGDRGVVVASDVRVVDPDHLDRAPAGLHHGTRVVYVEPAGMGENLPQFLGRQVGAGTVRTVPGEVAERVLQHRAGVVVGAEHERAGPLQQRGEGPLDRRYRVGVRQVVAGRDDQVGVGRRERGHPVLLAPLVGGQVQVGQVQDAQGFGIWRQYRDVEAPEREQVAFHQRGVGEGGAAEHDAGAGEADYGTRTHEAQGSFLVHEHAQGPPGDRPAQRHEVP